MAFINQKDATRACELIFNKVASTFKNTPDMTESLNFWNFQKFDPKSVAGVHATVWNLLEDPAQSTIGAEWRDGIIRDMLNDLVSGTDYNILFQVLNSNSFREGVKQRWARILSERSAQIGEYYNIGDEDLGGFTDYPPPWPKEPSNLYIGPHAVNVPGPEAIEITEHYGLNGAKGLRTDGDPIWREPVARLMITIDAIFSGVDVINTKLRPLVAYLKASPVTILNSPILNSSIIRKFHQEEAFTLLAAAQRNWDENEDKVRAFLAQVGLNDAETLATFKEKLQNNTELGREIEQAARNYVPPPEGADPGPLPHVPVMFGGLEVQTINDIVHGYRVRFHFFFMNDLCVSSDGMRFLDANGEETESIWECAWLKKYVEEGWLNENSDLYMPEYKPARMKFFYDSPISSFKIDPLEEDGKDVVVEAVVCNWQNKVATIPLLGQPMPSCQFLGRNNASVELMLNCNLKAVETLTKVKSSIESNVHSSLKDERADAIILQLPIANMLGLNEFVVSDVRTTTSDEMTDRYRIHVTMVEAKTTFKDRESLVLNQQSYTKELAKSLWDYFWEVMDNKWGNYTDGVAPENRREISESEFNDVILMMFNSFKTPMDGCLVNTDVIRAVTWINSEIREYLGETYVYNENYGVNGNPKNGGITLVNGRWSGIRGYEPTSVDVNEWFNFRYQNGWGKKEQRNHRNNFLWTWRKLVSVRGTDDIGSIYNRRRLFNYFASGSVIPRQKMRDAMFEALWAKQDPSLWQHMDRNHQLWAAKRDKYISDKLTEMGVKKDKDFWISVRETLSQGRFFNRDVGLRTPDEGLWKDQLEGTAYTFKYQQEVHRFALEYQDESPASKVKNAPKIWDAARVSTAYQSLANIAIHMPDLFPHWKINGEDPTTYLNGRLSKPVYQGRDTSGIVDSKRLSCYPDMALPSYRDVFTINGKLNRVWMKFAPTADVFGIPVALRPDLVENDDLDYLAVGPNDIVEPTFYYARGRYKRAAKEAETRLLAEEFLSEIANYKSFISVETTFDQFNQMVREGQEEHLTNLIQDLLRKEHASYERNSPRINSLRKETRERGPDDPIPELYVTTTHAPNDPSMIVAKAIVDPDDPTGQRLKAVLVESTPTRAVSMLDNSSHFGIDGATIRENMREIMARMPEDKQDVRRCFPTFRMRFIDFDSGLYHDEFYDYNAVREIHVFHDKYDASTCEIEILNYTGALDNDVFYTDAEARALGLDPEDEARAPEDERAGRYLRKMKLREGTCVQLLMGYSPDPKYLQPVFTGRISQVQPGEVIKIVAQGYKVELLNEISMEEEKIGTGNIVRKIFQHLDHEGHKNIDDIDYDERKNGTPHLGTRLDIASPRQIKEQNEVIMKMFGEDKITNGSSTWKSKAWGMYNDVTVPVYTVNGRTFADLFSDKPSRYRNIYYKDLVNKEFPIWGASYQPAFDVLEELTDFFPGWVCEVVPYDHLATLYVGPPDGYYYHTSQYNREVIKRLRGIVSQDRKERELQIRNDALDMLNDFSHYAWDYLFTARRVYRDQQGEGTTSIWKVALGAASAATVVGIPAAYAMDYKKYVVGGMREEFLPPDFRRNNIAGMVKDVRTRCPRVANMLIGAFFGFDLVSKSEFPPAVADVLWRIVDVVTEADGDIQSGNIRWDVPIVGGDYRYDTNVGWGDSAETTLDYLINEAPVMFEPHYRLSHFNDQRIQEMVGRIAFFHSPMWEYEDVEVEDLQYVTLLEQCQGNLTLRPSEKAALDAKNRGTIYPNLGKKPIDLYNVKWVETPVLTWKADGRAYTYTSDDPDNREIRFLNNPAKLPSENEVRSRISGRIASGKPTFTIYATREEIEQLKTVYTSGASFDIQTLTEQELLYRHGAVWESSGIRGIWTPGKWRIPMKPPRSFSRKGPLGMWVRDNLLGLKLYLYLMSKYLTEESKTETVRQVGEDLVEYQTLNAPLDKRPFRDYHHITSRYDVIQNNIVASMSEMANTVLLRYADGNPEYEEVDAGEGTGKGYILKQEETEWKVYKHPDGIPFHKHIKLEQKKLAIAIAKNATSDQMAAPVLLNKMGEALRPMYRGNLVIWGRHIKPHDVIYLNDDYTDMNGPIDVERVIHHFTPQTGWTTQIVPHALVNVDNKVDIFQVPQLQKFVDGLSSALDILSTAGIVWGVLTFGVGSFLSWGGKKLAQKALTHIVKKNVTKKIKKGATRRVKKAAVRKVIKAEAGTSGQLSFQFGGQVFEQTVAKEGAHQIAKNAAKEFAPWMKGFIRTAGSAGGWIGAGYILGAWERSIALSASEKIKGIVTLIPLMYEGRPLTAGLDNDDRYYISRAQAGWETLKVKRDKVLKWVRENLGGYASDREDEDPSFNPPGGG